MVAKKASPVAVPESAPEGERDRTGSIQAIKTLWANCVVRPWKFGWGRDLDPNNNPEAPIGLMEIFTLVGFVIASAAVLGASVQGEWTTELGKPVVFVFIAMIPLGAMFGMLRMRSAPADKVHLFHPGTVTMIRFSFGSCIALVLVAFSLVALGWFPGQNARLPREWKFLADDVEPYTWQFDSAAGIKVKIPVVLSDIPPGAEAVAIQATLLPALRNDWTIDLVDLYDEVTDTRVASTQVWATRETSRDPRTLTYFERADLSKNCRIEIFLHPESERAKGENAREDAMAAIRKKQGLRFYYLPDPYRTQPSD